MDRPYSCSYEGCTKAFKRRDRLEIHLRTHTGERPFICGVPGCDRTYARSQHLTQHIQRVHLLKNKLQERIACPHCPQDLANAESLRKHVKNFHSANSKERLYKFVYKQHDGRLVWAKKLHSCPHEGCDKQFVFPARLKRHMKVHQGYPCDINGCDEVLPTWTSLRKHKATVHCPSLICNTCGTVFKARSGLNQHLKLHDPDFKPITCDWEGCSRSFLYEKNLRQHIRSFHLGERVFKKKPKPKKPRKERKKISATATIFALDDRCKELKISRRNLPGEKSESNSNSQEEESKATCSTLCPSSPEMDAVPSSPTSDENSTNLDELEENHEDLCKDSIESQNFNSPCTSGPVFPGTTSS